MRKLIIAIYLVLVFVTIISLPNLALAQGIEVTVNQKPLSEILKTLSEKYEAKIAYDSQLASSFIITGSFSGSSVQEVVNQLLKGTTLEVILINDVLVIRPVFQETLVETVPEPPPIEFRLTGLVRDKSSHESLPYASVVVEGTTRGTATNSDGYFIFTTDLADSLQLVVSYLGYNSTKISVFPPHQNKQIIVDLNTQEIIIENTIIVKRQPDIIATDPSPGLLRWNSTRNTDIPSLNGLDIAAPLQLLPGIDGTTESLSGLLIRKSPSDKNLFIFDGFTIYHIDHFFGAFTSFNAKSVKDIRVFKGGFDARWGSRASSVIEITGKTGNSNTLTADVGLDLLSLDVMVEGPIGKKTTFLVAGRRSFTDFFRSGVYYQFLESARSDIVLASKSYPSFLHVDSDEPTFVYSDINAKLSFKPTEKDNLSFSVYGGNDRMKLEREGTYQSLSEDADWGNGGMGFRWSKQWSNKFSHVITLGASNYHLDYTHLDSTLKRRQNSQVVDTIQRTLITNNDLGDINLSWNNSLKFNLKNEFEFGIQANGVSIALDEVVKHILNFDPIIDTSRSRLDKMLHTTLWGQYNYTGGLIKSLKFGSRFSKYSATSKFYWEPRAQLSLALWKGAYLKFSAGKYFQYVNQIFTYSSASFRKVWVISDEDRFPVVSSNHFNGGFLFRLPKGTTIDIELYHKKTSRIILVQNVIRRIGNGNQVSEEQVYYNITNWVKGIDLLVHKEFPSAQVWLAYTLSKSTNTSEKINSGDLYPAPDNQLHEIKLAGTAKWEGFGITLAGIYGSGKPWDEPIFTTSFQLDPDYQKNSNLLPYYLRIDAGLNYSRKIGGAEAKVGINVFNVLNRNNQLSRIYQLSDTPLTTYFQTGTPLVYFDQMGMGIAQSVYFNVKF